MTRIDTPRNVTGLHKLLNPANIKPNIDLKKYEQDIINQRISNHSAVTAANTLEDVKKLLNNLDMELSSRTSKSHKYKHSKRSSSSSDSSSSASSSSGGTSSNSSSSNRSSASNSSSSNSSRSSKSSKSSSISSGSSNSSKSTIRMKSKMGTHPDNSFYGANLKDYTDEQKTRHHINDVLSSMDGTKSFNIDEERQRDWKINALNEISELRMILETEGVDLSHVPRPTYDDNDKLIRDIRSTLQYKNNRNMDYSLAEHIASTAAYGIEAVFNGERDFFGSKINMTGWHVNVKNKLRRRQFETTEFVSSVMREYNIGTGLRLGMELLFDAFMHHKSLSNRKKLTNGRTIPSEITTQDAILEITSTMDNNNS